MRSKNKRQDIIFLIGADGVGKTTLADKLYEELKNRNMNVRRGWSRYNNYFSKPLLAFTRLIKLNYIKEHNGHLAGYHEFQRSRLIGILFVILQAIDVNIATYFKICRRVPKEGLLICDRGPFDTVFDVILDTGFHNLGNTVWLKIYTMLVRNNCKVFYIHRNLEKTLASEKEELRYDKTLKQKRDIYNNYDGRLGWQRIDNNGSMNDAVKQILNKLEII